MRDEQGIALIGADGLWSALRSELGDAQAPRFAPPHRLARGRAGGAADGGVPRAADRALARARAHLVHYPVKGGSEVNIVAIVRDDWHEPGWSAPGRAGELVARFACFARASARAILAAPEAGRNGRCSTARRGRWGNRGR